MSPMQPPSPPQGSSGADPSMEDILASIRRILNEDDQPAGAPAERPAPKVVALSEDMLVEDAPEAPDAAAAAPPPAAAPMPEDEVPAAPVIVPPPPADPVAVEPAAPSAPAPVPTAAPPAAPAPAAPSGLDALVAPDAAAAAAASVNNLLRTLMTEREQVHVYRGGPTIEDLVREEVRSLLKVWLDTNLPPLVERLVRAEIERVVGRATS